LFFYLILILSFNIKVIRDWVLYFYFLFFMRLLYSHDLNHEFCKLIWLTWLLCYFFNWIFFSVFPSILVLCEYFFTFNFFYLTCNVTIESRCIYIAWTKLSWISFNLAWQFKLLSLPIKNIRRCVQINNHLKR
jgi:hypothetical protein